MCEPSLPTLGDRVSSDGCDGELSSDSGSEGNVQHGVGCGALAFFALLDKNDATTLWRDTDLTTFLDSCGYTISIDEVFFLSRSLRLEVLNFP